jgi:hypothetical protein
MAIRELTSHTGKQEGLFGGRASGPNGIHQVLFDEAYGTLPGFGGKRDTDKDAAKPFTEPISFIPPLKGARRMWRQSRTRLTRCVSRSLVPTPQQGPVRVWPSLRRYLHPRLHPLSTARLQDLVPPLQSWFTRTCLGRRQRWRDQYSKLRRFLQSILGHSTLANFGFLLPLITIPRCRYEARRV